MRHSSKGKGKHLITMKTEHKAVLDTTRELERQGLRGDLSGAAGERPAELDDFVAAIRPDTILASVMFVNNEIGVIQPIEQLGEICRSKGIVFHVDAAHGQPVKSQLTCKAQGRPDELLGAQDVRTKGIGALYRRKPRIRIEAQMRWRP